MEGRDPSCSSTREGQEVDPGHAQNCTRERIDLVLSSPGTSYGLFALCYRDIWFLPARATLKQAAGEEEPPSPRCPPVPAHSAVAHVGFGCGTAPSQLPSAEPAPTPRNDNVSLASLKEHFPGHICNFAESHSPNGWLEILHGSLDATSPRSEVLSLPPS